MNPDDPAVVDILRRAMVARIATVSRNGRPLTSTRCTSCRGTGKSTSAPRTERWQRWNVKANPRVTILFDVEREPNDRRVLTIHGTAIVRTDSRLCRWYVVRDYRKYILSRPGFLNALAHIDFYRWCVASSRRARRERNAVLEVRPEWERNV